MSLPYDTLHYNTRTGVASDGTMTAVGRFKVCPRGLFSRGRGGWLAIMAAVLVAFSWQSFVTQTHRHFDDEAFSAATTGIASPESDRKAPSSLPDNCTMCREIAHSGQLVLPAAIAFDAPVATAFWLADSALPGLALGQRSHAWRSRAPPYQLQA